MTPARAGNGQMQAGIGVDIGILGKKTLKGIGKYKEIAI